MEKFNVVLREEVVKQQCKSDLQKAKMWLTEVHDRLRNHELHNLADEVFELIEKTNHFIWRLK